MMRWITIFFGWLLAVAAQGQTVPAFDDVPVFYQQRIMPAATYARLTGVSMGEVLSELPESFRPIPMMHHGEDTWLSVRTAQELEFNDVEMMAAATALQSLQRELAEKEPDGTKISEAISVHRQFVMKRLTRVQDVTDIANEVTRDRLGLWKWGAIACVLLLVLSAVCSRKLFGFGLLVLWLVLVGDLIWGGVLAGRVPVYTFGERVYMWAVFVGLISLSLCLRGAKVPRYASPAALALMLLGCVSYGLLSARMDTYAQVSGTLGGSWAYATLVFCTLASLAMVSALLVICLIGFVQGKGDETERVDVLMSGWSGAFAWAVAASVAGVVWSSTVYGVLYYPTRLCSTALLSVLISGAGLLVARQMNLSVKVWRTGTVVLSLALLLRVMAWLRVDLLQSAL